MISVYPGTVAMFALPAAAAETWRVSAIAHLSDRFDTHDLTSRPTVPDQFRHVSHLRSRVFKKRVVASAEIVHTRLTIRGFEKAILRAFTITGKKKITLPAHSGQSIPFGLAEFPLLKGVCKRMHRSLKNVAEQITRFNKVIATVKISVVLQSQTIATCPPENADGSRLAEPAGQGSIEVEHKRPTDVSFHPFVEDLVQKTPPLFRTHGAPGNPITLLGTGLTVRIDTFDDRNELYVLSFELVTEKPVDRERMIGVYCIDGAENIELDPVLLQMAGRLQDPLEGAVSALVHAVGIVKLFRAIHAQADEEVVLFEEPAPFVVEKDAICLEGVLDRDSGFPVLFLKFHRVPEEVETHERRLTPLPGYSHPGDLVGFEELADIGLMNLIRHAKSTLGIELILFEEKAVRTIKIALRACRFDHHMKR